MLFLQEKRKKAQKIQLKNTYLHRLSRGGYDLFKHNMMLKKLKKCQKVSQSLGASGIVDPPSPPTRHELCKEARKKKLDEYTYIRGNASCC